MAKQKTKSHARKTSSDPVKIYKYGIRLTRTDGIGVVSALRGATDYYNDLVAIENGRRMAARAACSRIVPAYAAKEAECVALQDDTDRLGKIAKATDDEGDHVLHKDAQQRSRAAWADLKPLRIEAYADASVQEEMALSKTIASDLGKNLRAHSSVFWTTRGRLETAFGVARKSPGSVKRKRFEPTGGIGGQILGRDVEQPDGTKVKVYMTTSSVFGGLSTNLQIDAEPIAAGVGGRPIHTGRIRVGSIGRDPLWLEFSVVLHRPLPSGGIIKNAWVFARRCGNRIKHELHMTVESASLALPPPTKHTVAVALGYRRVGGDVHVASAVGVGWIAPRHMVLPKKIFDRFDHCESLRGAADIHFETARGVLLSHLETVDVSDEIADATIHVAQWRSAKRLARVANMFAREHLGERRGELWRQWRDMRLGVSLDLFDTFSVVAEWCESIGIVCSSEVMAVYLEIWRRKNAHLYQVESDLRRKARAWRDDLMRKWVASLRGHRLIVCDRDFSREAADDGETHSNVRRLRAQSSPGRLKALLKESGGELVAAEAAESAAGMDSCVAHCIGALEASGEDMTNVEEMIERQRATLRSLREMDHAAE